MKCENCKEREARAESLRAICVEQNDYVCQILGRELGYSWYKDDQENFPGATEDDGVFIYDNDAATVAEQAAKKIRQLEGDLRRLKQRLHAR